MKLNIMKLAATSIALSALAITFAGAQTSASQRSEQMDMGYQKGIQYLAPAGNLLGIWWERKCDGQTNVWQPVVPGAANGVGISKPFKNGCGTSNWD